MPLKMRLGYFVSEWIVGILLMGPLCGTMVAEDKPLGALIGFALAVLICFFACIRKIVLVQQSLKRTGFR